MSKSGVVKLCDFGFARTLGEYDIVQYTYPSVHSVSHIVPDCTFSVTYST